MWLLVIFTVGSMQTPVLIPGLPSQAACEQLGPKVSADQKQANSANRYLWHCYDVSDSRQQPR